jgi:hypothetical protein
MDESETCTVDVRELFNIVNDIVEEWGCPMLNRGDCNDPKCHRGDVCNEIILKYVPSCIFDNGK